MDDKIRIAELNLTGKLAHRTRFHPQADRTIIDTIEFGVLYVMAFWSGQARVAFVELKRVLEAVDHDGRLELVVVDTDGCPELDEVPEFREKMHGAGETAWVRNGRITQTSGLGYHPECFEPNTRKMLAECPA